MSVKITTTSLPNGVVGVPYSHTVSTSGGAAPLAFTKPTGALPTGLSAINSTTGAITGTPSAAGTYNFTIHVVDDDSTSDTAAYTVIIYADLVVSPEPLSGDDAVFIEGGSQVQFSATGGSGHYQWSVDGGNLINSVSGLLTAVNGGSYNITVIDTESGQVVVIPIVITTQSQFCVQGERVELDTQVSDVCCEFNVECGDRLQLRVPSFYLRVNGQQKSVIYSDIVQAVTGAASALRSTSDVAGAAGNEVSFARDAVFEIVTSYDMAQEANGEFGIGFSSSDADSTVASIEHAVVWFTNGTSDRVVEVRHGGTTEADSQFPIAQGDAVSFGGVDGVFKLYINNVLVFTSAVSAITCGNAILDIGIEDADKTIGGYVTNLTWSIVTGGSAGEVGSIDADGVYTSPSNPIAGIIKVKGTLNNANFFVGVRNIQPTPIFTKPQALLFGRQAHIWVTNRRATDNEIIRIASDGSPDAIQNPGMIYLGVLEASATFAEDNKTQDFENDDGIYGTVVTSEQATLTATFLEVRDLEKLALLMQRATLHPKVKGVSEISVGGKTCGGCDLRVALIVQSGSCGGGYDVIYMPRAQNVGNLSLEIGRKASAKNALNFRVLPDKTRPIGKQLYSIYQIENCSDFESTDSCE